MTPKSFDQFLKETSDHVADKAVTEVIARMPIGYANYKGRITERRLAKHLTFDDTPFGPSYMGEYLWPVTADYDEAADRTRVGFSLIPPPGWQEAGAR